MTCWKSTQGYHEKDPPEEALHIYYEGVDTQQPYEAVRDQIIQSIHQRRQAKLRNAYVDSIRKLTTVNIRLTPPRAQVNLKETPVRRIRRSCPGGSRRIRGLRMPLLPASPAGSEPVGKGIQG